MILVAQIYSSWCLASQSEPREDAPVGQFAGVFPYFLNNRVNGKEMVN